MRYILSFVIISLLVTGTVSAQLPSKPYIGLFIDEARSSWCTEGVPLYLVQMYIYFLPSERGIMCLEFVIEYPQNVIQSTITPHYPSIECWIEGPWDEGVTVCFRDCVMDWTWSHCQDLWVTDLEYSVVRILPHPAVGALQVASCEPGFPVEPCTNFTQLYINGCGPTGVDEASWGAIKSMYQ
ncbi:MAG: hypothetical protein JSV33_12225 [bacterium]|nr:MAG: hypothetical protein JSV33_12225 [bacterium]